MKQASQRASSRVFRLAGLTSLALLASGCATVTPDGGFDGVATLVAERLGANARIVRNDADRRALRGDIDSMLRTPLSSDAAVQIALLNNRALQSTYWSVGIAEADLVQAGRLANPSLSFQRTHAGAAVEIERSLTFGLASLLSRLRPPVVTLLTRKVA